MRRNHYLVGNLDAILFGLCWLARGVHPFEHDAAPLLPKCLNPTNFRSYPTIPCQSVEIMDQNGCFSFQVCAWWLRHGGWVYVFAFMPQSIRWASSSLQWRHLMKYDVSFHASEFWVLRHLQCMCCTRTSYAVPTNSSTKYRVLWTPVPGIYKVFIHDDYHINCAFSVWHWSLVTCNTGTTILSWTPDNLPVDRHRSNLPSARPCCCMISYFDLPFTSQPSRWEAESICSVEDILQRSLEPHITHQPVSIASDSINPLQIR